MGQKAKGFLCLLVAFLITLIPIFDVSARSKHLSTSLEVRLHDAYWWRADGNICQNKNSTTDGSNVTIIGDSITEITAAGQTVNGAKHPDNHNDTNDFEEYLPEAEIYAQWGKSFWTDDGNDGGEGGKVILDRLASEGNLREIVVYALGTNNEKDLTADKIQDVIDTIGDDHTIVFMTMSDNGTPFSDNNALVEEAAASNESVVIADWAGAAGSNPSLYFDQNDTVHPSIHEGTKLFAETIYEAISCVNENEYDDTLECGLTGENTNYAGDQIFSESELATIEANYPFYKAAADAVGIPWQILAVIHSMEHGLQRDNPSNGQGAYQLYSYVQSNGQFLPAGPISDEEFARQSKIAAEVIAAKARGLNLSNDSGVKKLFFLYNGTASAYKNQARAMGYTEEEANNGEGSPYVMNRFDAKRDPTAGAGAPTWGQIKSDGGGIEYPANSGFGAYVKYLAIAGGCSYGGISADDANNESGIMGRYRKLASNFIFSNVDNLSHVGCVNGVYNNCSAFSAWYINNYTNGSTVTNYQGSEFVSRLLNNFPGEYTDGGKVPAVGAIMSSGPYSGSAEGWANHTGVVLGIDEANDQIIIGEASCSNGYNSNWPGAHTYSLSKYTNNSSQYGPTYAYPKSFKGF